LYLYGVKKSAALERKTEHFSKQNEMLRSFKVSFVFGVQKM
jgi:hypothetical protein